MAVVQIKRHNGSGWDNIDPKVDWSSIQNKPTSFTPTSHTHTEYLKTNPDGDGVVIAYSDANPTIDGQTTGGGHQFGADGILTNGYITAKAVVGKVVHGDNGFYVGAMTASTGGTGVKIADSVGQLFVENKVELSYNAVDNALDITFI